MVHNTVTVLYNHGLLYGKAYYGGGGFSFIRGTGKHQADRNNLHTLKFLQVHDTYGITASITMSTQLHIEERNL